MIMRGISALPAIYILSNNFILYTAKNVTNRNKYYFVKYLKNSSDSHFFFLFNIFVNVIKIFTAEFNMNSKDDFFF